MPTLVDLAAVKAHLRKTTTDEDALIGSYRSAAIGWVEEYTGHVLEQRVVTDAFYQWGDFLTLRHQPITVDDPTPTLTVIYLDTEDAETEYEDRIIRDQTYPWTLHAPFGSEFPAIADNSSITVEYTAGYAAGEVPANLNAAVLLLCAHWHSNRSAVAEGQFEALPLAVESLCRPYRGAVLA